MPTWLPEYDSRYHTLNKLKDVLNELFSLLFFISDTYCLLQKKTTLFYIFEYIITSLSFGFISLLKNIFL